MKNFLLTATLLISTATFSQVHKTAIIGLSHYQANVIHAYSSQSVPCHVEDGELFEAPTLFNQLTKKIDSLVTLLGFELIPADSIINNLDYKALAEANYKARQEQTNSFPQITAKGYGYLAGNAIGGISNLAEYFKIAPSADLLIEAHSAYDLKLTEPVKDGRIKGFVSCNLFITGYSSKKKKIIKFKSKFETPMSLFVRPAETTWGYRIISGFGALQMDAFEGALKKLDAGIPKEKLRVEKFYSK